MLIRISAAILLAAGCHAAPAPAPPPPPPPPRVPEPEPPAELKDLRELIRKVEDQAERLIKQSHEALDAGDYERAEGLHRNAKELKEAAVKMRAQEEGLVRAAARRLLQDLDHEEIAVRDAAIRELLTLGAPAELLRELAKGLSVETSRRLDQVLNRRQWASGAKASTEYSGTNWCAAQATGPPNTDGAGDFTTAWASRESDSDSEWLQLTFEAAVRPGLIRVHETYNAGAISKVEVRDEKGEWHTVWEGHATAAATPRWFEVEVAPGSWTTREIRLTVDSNAVPGWNEIDAVELVGALR